MHVTKKEFCFESVTKHCQNKTNGEVNKYSQLQHQEHRNRNLPDLRTDHKASSEIF